MTRGLSLSPSSLRACASLVALTSSSLGCGLFREPPPLPPQEVLVRVRAGDKEPIAGVVVTPSAGQPGRTDGDGVAILRLDGEEGARLELSVACPAGYAASAATTSVTIRRASRPPELDVRCKHLEHAVVVAFKTTGATGVPIQYLGREIARTDDAGFALVELEPAAGETLKLTLDTSDPKFQFLRPQNPELAVLVPEGDEAFALEQKFIEDRPAAKKFVARPPPRPVNLGTLPPR